MFLVAKLYIDTYLQQGHRSRADSQRNPTSIFIFPKEEAIQKQWLLNIAKNTEEKPEAKMYAFSLHFKEADYKVGKVCRETERQVRSLKKGAVPTVFNKASYPSYMKDVSVKKRTTNRSSSEARRIKYEEQTEAWLASDRFTSLEDLKGKLSVDLLPSFRLSLDMDEICEKNYITLFTYKSAMENNIRIAEDGSFTMYKHGTKIPSSRLRGIIHDHRDRFTMVSQLLNAVAFLNNFQTEDND